MDSWPHDSRNVNASHAHRRTGQKEVPSNLYPNVQQGMAAAVTLVDMSGRFVWTSLLGNGDEELYRGRLKVGKSFVIFPPSRPLPIPTTRYTTKEHAEQGANFLRTYLPDVDVATELIREQISKESLRAQELERFDPYLGSTLATTFKDFGATSSTGYLIYAMGEVGHQLNISNIIFTRSKGMTIEPDPIRVSSYATPIQQIVVPTGATSMPEPIISVRTYSSTVFSRLNSQDGAVSPGTLRTLSPGVTGGREIVDLKLYSHDFVAVNDQGTVYRGSISEAEAALCIFKCPTTAVPKDEYYWRLSSDACPHQFFVSSSEQVWAVDSRAGKSSLLLELPINKDYITSVEDCQDDSLLPLCTTSQLIWIDKRSPGKPLLALQHNRRFDRYLSARTVCSSTRMLLLAFPNLSTSTSKAVTVLTSLRNDLITIYDVSHSKDSLIYMGNPPYGLLPGNVGFAKHVSHTTVSSPFPDDFTDLTILRLSEQGAIGGINLTCSDLPVEAPAIIENLNTLTKSYGFYHDMLKGQEKSQVDFFPLYDQISRSYIVAAEQAETIQAEAVKGLLNEMPSYLQRSELPSEHLLTMYDVALRTGEEPGEASRTDFLVDNILNSTQGLRALQDGCLPIETLASKVPWHCDLRPALNRLYEDQKYIGQQVIQKYIVDRNAVASASYSPTVTVLKKAEEELTVDLTLTRYVFSAVPFSKIPNLGQSLEVMTEALSLGDEPPIVEFGCLRPTSRGDTDHYKQGSPEGVTFGMDVRSLLEEWVVGSDPYSYFYRDPYDIAENIIPVQRVVPNHQTIGTEIPAKVHRPPQILSTTMKSALKGGGRNPQQYAMTPTKLGYGSQQIFETGSLQGESQDAAVTSTQVLPGPYGGRNNKKAAKKRLGGF